MHIFNLEILLQDEQEPLANDFVKAAPSSTDQESLQRTGHSKMKPWQIIKVFLSPSFIAEGRHHSNKT